LQLALANKLNHRFAVFLGFVFSPRFYVAIRVEEMAITKGPIGIIGKGAMIEVIQVFWN
jgi:hypothetical protein